MAKQKKQPKQKAVLKAPRRVADLIVFGQKVHDQLAANTTLLPTPDPALTVLQTHLTDLVTKEAAAKTRAVGAVSARNTAEQVVRSDLETERAYVEKLANATPSEAANLAQSAGMTLYQGAPRNRPDLVAKHGALSGSVDLVAKALTGAKANDWQVSTDGGKTWNDAGSTTKAKVTVPNLTGTTATFRHRVLTKAGRTDWSQPVSLVVS